MRALISLALLTIGLLGVIGGVVIFLAVHNSGQEVTVFQETEALLVFLIGTCGLGFAGIISAWEEKLDREKKAERERAKAASAT